MRMQIKKIVLHTFALIVLLAVTIAVTGIPHDFNIVAYNGQNIPNMDNRTLLRSMWNNLLSLISGDAFYAKIQGEYVSALLIRTAVKSFVILFFGSLIALIAGIIKGVIESRKKDRASTAKLLFSLVPLSLPDLLTITLVHLTAVYLQNNGISILGIKPLPPYGDDTILHAIYPVISISILPAAYIARITSGVIEENMTKLYILAARGKGCSRFKIIKNHLLKDILYNVLSGYPTVIGILFSSLIIVERLFYYRGIGFYLIFLRTSPLIPVDESKAAFTVFVCFLAVLYYLIYTFLDISKNLLLPKIRT